VAEDLSATLTAAACIGTPAAVAVARVFASSLYGVEPIDGAASIAAIAVIAFVALAATWLPARRASRIR
jgi:putative ABC transport system permease protein